MTLREGNLVCIPHSFMHNDRGKILFICFFIVVLVFLAVPLQRSKQHGRHGQAGLAESQRKDPQRFSSSSGLCDFTKHEMPGFDGSQNYISL